MTTTAETLLEELAALDPDLARSMRKYWEYRAGYNPTDDTRTTFEASVRRMIALAHTEQQPCPPNF